MTAPLSRRWLWLAAAAALILTFAQSPGKISPDTKLDLTANPVRFLARAFNLWNSELPFGQAQNQAYGYLFPHGAFFLAGDVLGLPGWVTQRLWWALLLTVGFWGLLRVAEALNDGRGIGSPTSRVIAAAAFALSPRVLTTLGAISSETLPMMLAPWVLLPVIIALQRGSTEALRGNRQVRVMAARSAVAIALMGAVNAVATLTGCLAAAIWLASHRPNRLWWRFTAWWTLCIVLAVLWWVVALFMLGRISPPFLDFIESSGVTTQWMSLTEMLRGTDAWTPFVAPNATAGTSLVTGSVAVLATTLVAAAGMAGLAMRTMPARGRLIVILLIGVILLALGYSGGLGSPLAHQVQAFLDADGTPLRNIHKLEPLLRLPLALGLAHLLGRIPLPGSAPRREWVQAFAHPERDKRVAVGLVVLVALAAATSLAWTGRLTPPGASLLSDQTPGRPRRPSSQEKLMADHAVQTDLGTPPIGAALRDTARGITSYWWTWLVGGIAWLAIALVILQFDSASVATVGILVGLMFVFVGLQTVALARVPWGPRWVSALFAMLFLVSGILCFVEPRATFAGLADMLGFLFLIVGVWWMIRSFVERAVNPLWWTGLISGILMTGMAFWTAGQFFIERAYVLLVFAGVWALMQGITDIVRAFTVRRVHESLGEDPAR